MHEVLVGLQFESIFSIFTCAGSSCSTRGGKLRHCVKIFWLERKLRMLCIKMFWRVTLFLKFLCGTWEDLACQRCGEVCRALVLGQFGSGGNKGGHSGQCCCGVLRWMVQPGSSLQCLWCCLWISTWMPVSYGFIVPGSRGISVSCSTCLLNYLLFVSDGKGLIHASKERLWDIRE